MSLHTLLTKPVTLRYEVAGPVDEYGQPTTVTTLVPQRCYVRSRASLVDGAEVRTEQTLRVTLPVDVVTTGLAGVVLDGLAFDLDGVPFRQWNPRTGETTYVAVDVRRAA